MELCPLIENQYFQLEFVFYMKTDSSPPPAIPPPPPIGVMLQYTTKGYRLRKEVMQI